MSLFLDVETSVIYFNFSNLSHLNAIISPSLPQIDLNGQQRAWAILGFGPAQFLESARSPIPNSSYLTSKGSLETDCSF